MSIEIFGENLEKAFLDLGITAKRTYQAKNVDGYIKPEVWEVSDNDFKTMCSLSDDDWKDDWGWWRNGGCIYEGAIEAEYDVNGKKMFGYRDKRIGAVLEDVDHDDKDDVEYAESCVDEYKNQKFASYIQWLYETQSASTSYNIAYFAFSLAKDNGLKLADFMAKFQP